MSNKGENIDKIDKKSSNNSSVSVIKGQKRSVSPNSSAECHSFNKWESVDLGDDDRKKKFLRLMGAGKKEHPPGKQDDPKETRPDTPKDERPVLDNEKINKDLEEQFNHSMQDKLTGKTRDHVGFGFQDDTEHSESEGEKYKDNEDQNCTSKRTTLLGFVKSSDS